MNKKYRFLFLKCVGYILGISWFALALYLGAKTLIIWNKYSPNMAAIFLPVYFFLWIGALFYGRYFIEVVAQRITSKLKYFKKIEG